MKKTVLGTTPDSGKPIYLEGNTTTKGWTREDHIHAAKIHRGNRDTKKATAHEWAAEQMGTYHQKRKVRSEIAGGMSTLQALKTAVQISHTGAPKGITYSEEKGWTGGDSRTLYHITDVRTDQSKVRPGPFLGVGPMVRIRVATRAEAEEGWQKPLHSGWKVEG